MLTIIASMEHELAGLRRELGPGRSPGGAGNLPGGKGSLKPELLVVGVGGKRAGVKVRSLLAPGQRPPVTLLMLGFAGAVDPALGTGDLVLASRYYRADPVENPVHAPVAKADLPAPPLAKADPIIPPLAKGGNWGVT